jgi:homogentisate 1,2-dioxygenase
VRYPRLGQLPRKRHTQFRTNGRLLIEEVMGLEGFSGNESILYHHTSPCRIAEAGEFEPIFHEEWVPDAHVHRHLKTGGIPAKGDPVSGRRCLMWNNHLEVSICRPVEESQAFYRNGEGDELIFVHDGSGELETVFGTLPYREHDYIVIPRGTMYRFRFSTEGQLWLCMHTPGEFETPNRYRNRYGQLLESAPFSHRDLHPPEQLETHREEGNFELSVRVRRGLQH